jgi:nicotinate phosphoribosyltransferase
MTTPLQRHLFPAPQNMAACVDLYELTMAAGYFAQGMQDREAAFELSVRRLPKGRSYLIAAGLEQALHCLHEMRFGAEDIRYLHSQQAFTRVNKSFFDYLRRFRFTGEVIAMPEGTAAFAGEPLLIVRAPLIEAQIVETYLLTTLTFQTLVASKAARIVRAARGRPVADFGTRRAHGPQAGLLAARAAFIGGVSATSNLLAARALGIPSTGTQAHSWIMAFDDEREAFRRYAELFPDSTILLIDTYDTLRGARHAAEIGPRVKAVRLDSGDLLSLSRKVRRILDEAGLRDVKIVASGDLNERRIDRLLRRRAPIDLFGVGTELVTSRDDPALSGVYKLVRIGRGAAASAPLKLSRGKISLPHLKQVFRRSRRSGRFLGDIIGLYREKSSGEPLLKRVMRGGRIVHNLPSLQKIQAHCRAQIDRLPPPLLDLDGGSKYPVTLSPALRAASDEAIRQTKARMRR